MTRIHLFNHAEDAWESNLAIWLEQRSHESFSGHETWFVTNTHLQGNWIRRLALSHRKTLFGIHFFDRRTLRKHLCCLFGLPDPSYLPQLESYRSVIEQGFGKPVARLLIYSTVLARFV